MGQNTETTLKIHLRSFILRSALPGLSNSLLPFIQSPYYYYHHKALDLNIAKSEIQLFHHPEKIFVDHPDCLNQRPLLFRPSLDKGCEIVKKGIYFPLHTRRSRCKDRISPARAPCSPFLFQHNYNQHLRETRKKKKRTPQSSREN